MARSIRTYLLPLGIVLTALIFWVAFSGTNLDKPRLEVLKSKRELRLYDGGQLLKTYQVALGANPVPAKEREGDMATPEGEYFICLKNPRSAFCLSLAINYPNAADAERGFKAGVITTAEREAILQAAARRETPPWKTPLGGEVFVHGGGGSSDWTWGCVALENPDIKELYRLVPVGTPITIRP